MDFTENDTHSITLEQVSLSRIANVYLNELGQLSMEENINTYLESSDSIISHEIVNQEHFIETDLPNSNFSTCNEEIVNKEISDLSDNHSSNVQIHNNAEIHGYESQFEMKNSTKEVNIEYNESLEPRILWPLYDKPLTTAVFIDTIVDSVSIENTDNVNLFLSWFSNKYIVGSGSTNVDPSAGIASYRPDTSVGQAAGSSSKTTMGAFISGQRGRGDDEDNSDPNRKLQKIVSSHYRDISDEDMEMLFDFIMANGINSMTDEEVRNFGEMVIRYNSPKYRIFRRLVQLARGREASNTLLIRNPDPNCFTHKYYVQRPSRTTIKNDFVQTFDKTRIELIQNAVNEQPVSDQLLPSASSPGSSVRSHSRSQGHTHHHHNTINTHQIQGQSAPTDLKATAAASPQQNQTQAQGQAQVPPPSQPSQNMWLQILPGLLIAAGLAMLAQHLGGTRPRQGKRRDVLIQQGNERGPQDFSDVIESTNAERLRIGPWSVGSRDLPLPPINETFTSNPPSLQDESTIEFQTGRRDGYNQARINLQRANPRDSQRISRLPRLNISQPQNQLSSANNTIINPQFIFGILLNVLGILARRHNQDKNKSHRPDQKD